MPQKRKRIPIPRAIEADVLFASDRTCCVCRVKGRQIQIHHIDDNPANNDPKNLAVLCLECHNDTQIRGGFGRKLNANQVIRYRDDWLIQVATSRVAHAEDNEQIEQKVVGMLQFHQAITNRDWEQAERVLQKHQNLLAGRSTLGLGMSKEVQDYFSTLLYRYVHPHWPESRLTETWSLPQLMVDIQRVIQWLEEALNHQDDPEGQVSATLPLIYGFNEEYGKMMSAVGAICTNYPTLLSDLQMPDHLMMLIYACHKEQSRIHALMKALDLPLPSEKEVCIAIQEPSASIQDQASEWYAVERYAGANASKMPVKVRILCPHLQEAVQVTRALIFGQGEQAISRPDYFKEPDPTHPSERAFDLPVDVLLQQLFEEFLFLCSTR